MQKPEVLRKKDSPGSYESIRNSAAFSSCNRYNQLTPLGRKYYPKALVEKRTGFSFLVHAGDAPFFQVDCDLMDKTLGRFGGPLRIIPSQFLTADQFSIGIKAVFHELDLITKQCGEDTVVFIEETETGECLSPIGASALARQGVPETVLFSVVDLKRSENEIHADIRKSYRSLINWGKKNLKLKYVNTENPDRELFDTYRALHRTVSEGGSVRPESSWDEMFDAVASGNGEVSIGTLETGETVSGTMVLSSDDVAWYASGAYDRSNFDKPLGHWPLYNAILRARSRNFTVFDIGDLPAFGKTDEKNYQIGRFKSGFTNTVATRLQWRFISLGK